MLTSKYTIHYNSCIYLTSAPNGKRGHLITGQGGLVFQTPLPGLQSDVLHSQILAIPSEFLCLMCSH